ncbi:MAG: hypothetical protein ACKORJ_03935, partial [Bacteroidota bacterium]
SKTEIFFMLWVIEMILLFLAFRKRPVWLVSGLRGKRTPSSAPTEALQACNRRVTGCRYHLKQFPACSYLSTNESHHAAAER